MGRNPDHVSESTVMRIQVVRGGTLELRGLYAARVVKYLREEHMANLEQAGFEVVGKFGGVVIQTDQRALPLDDPDQQKRTKAVKAQIVANLAPADEDIAAIKAALVKNVVEDVTYDQETGLYVITTGPGAGKKGKRFDVRFMNGTVSPVEPKKKPAKKDDPKPSGDYATKPGTGLAMTDESYAKLVDIAAARKKPHNYFHTILLLILDVSNADDKAVEYGRNIDRWRWAAGVGLDDKDLLTHIAEALGGKNGRAQTVGDFTHHLSGAKKKPGIVFCSELADKKLPKWCSIDDRELFHGPNGDLLKIVRDVLHIPQPVKD